MIDGVHDDDVENFKEEYGEVFDKIKRLVTGDLEDEEIRLFIDELGRGFYNDIINLVKKRAASREKLQENGAATILPRMTRQKIAASMQPSVTLATDRFCSNCGVSVQISANFCSKCGASMHIQTPPVPKLLNTHQYPETIPDSSKSFFTSKVVGSLLVCLGICLIFVAVFTLFTNILHNISVALSTGAAWAWGRLAGNMIGTVFFFLLGLKAFKAGRQRF